MPYIERAVPQALDLIDPGVKDVYSSPNVFINNVPVALWNSPGVSGALGSVTIPIDPPPESYAPNPEQVLNTYASQNLADTNPLGGYIDKGKGAGSDGAIATGNMPGTNTSDPNDLAGNPPAADAPAITPASGESVWGRLENFINSCIEEGAAGQWDEQTQKGNPSSPANPKIMYCFQQMGFTRQQLDKQFSALCGDQVPWCAAFAGTVLKTAGSTWLKSNLAAKAYSERNWGAKSIPVSDPNQWRRNDLIVINAGGGNHVGFIRGVDLQNDRFAIAGGNQSDSCNQMNFRDIRKIYYVGRAWDLPPEADKSIIGTLKGSGSGKTR